MRKTISHLIHIRLHNYLLIEADVGIRTCHFNYAVYSLFTLSKSRYPLRIIGERVLQSEQSIVRWRVSLLPDTETGANRQWRPTYYGVFVDNKSDEGKHLYGWYGVVRNYQNSLKRTLLYEPTEHNMSIQLDHL